MSLRINHNIQALNGHNNMVRNSAMVAGSLEKLSSGLRINKAADDAAGLVISEQMRAQIGGLNQAVSNSETAVSMVQTAEGSLNEINSLLLKGRDLVLHASNSAANDHNQLLADQKELDNAIETIGRIADQTQFGTKKLLDGSLAGAQGYDTNVVRKFDVGTQLMARSDFKGDATVSLTITASATATVISGTTGSVAGGGATLASFMAGGVSALGFSSGGSAIASLGSFLGTSTNAIAEGGSVTITVGGVDFKFENQESVGDIVSQLNSKQSAYTIGYAAVADTGFTATRNLLGVSGQQTDLKATGVNGLKATAADKGTGSAAVLNAATTGITAGTQTSATLTGLTLGSNTNVTVNLVSDLSDASVLTSNAYGIKIDATNAFVGAANNTTTFAMGRGALFQVGANDGQLVSVDMKSVSTTKLGLDGDKRTAGRLDSLSSLKSTQALVNGDFTGALQVMDKAIDDVTNLRGQLGAFQANTLESGLNNLRTAHENLTAAESTIRDVDFAAESSNFTKNNILVQASTAMLAQANQLPQQVLQLLSGR